MRCTLMLLTTLGIYAAPATAQAASQDLQIAQTLVTELRELRQDLRNTAASIQRVQIVMYRLQAQATLVDKAAQRLIRLAQNAKEQRYRKHLPRPKSSERKRENATRKMHPSRKLLKI